MKITFKNLRYLLEALPVRLGLFIFGSLKVETSSNIGAFLTKFIGKRTSVHKLAQSNLAKAMPELSETKRNEILDDMWDNLGRVVGEYSHIANCTAENIVRNFITYDDTAKYNVSYIKETCKGGIIFSGHLGNWEIGPKFFLNQGIKVSTVYRPLNNPYVENMTAKLRGVDLITKSAKGNKQIIQEIKNGNYVLVMVDQKMTNGIPLKFFNNDAITTTSIAKIALRYNIPLIPARSIRVGKKSKFIVSVEKPVLFTENEDDVSLTEKINNKLEDWIREYPSQWFWVHNRWKK